MTIPNELRELLERVAKPVLFRHQEDAHADACAELRALLSSAPAQPASPAQPEVQRLREALRITRDTIDRQLEVIASRATGNYLDKLPVVRSLKAHRARCDAALAASTGQEVE